MAKSLVAFPPRGWAGYQRHRSEIAELLDPRCYTIEWLDVEVLNRRVHLLDNEKAVIAFEFKTYPAGATELHGVVAAGELPAILELIDEVETLVGGVTFASIASRAGWVKALKSRGYETHQVVVRKELRNGA